MNYISIPTQVELTHQQPIHEAKAMIFLAKVSEATKQFGSNQFYDNWPQPEKYET